MARGGYRPGAGRPRKSVAPKAEKQAKIAAPIEIEPIKLKPGQIEPLDYMLAVINNPEADQARRDRMAIAAAPYRHARADEMGKKDQRQQKAEGVGGRFAVPGAPRLVVSNK